jgi:hypothetical protein
VFYIFNPVGIVLKPFFFVLVPLRVSYIGANDTWTQTGITVAGGNEKGAGLNQLNNPYGLYVDDNETIYIADFGNDRIVEWKYGAISGQIVADGNRTGNRADRLNGPKDVIVDKKTDILIICDSRNKKVVGWPRGSNTGIETIIIRISCTDLTMDGNGFLYVFDHDKNQVRRWQVGRTHGTILSYINSESPRLDQLRYPSYVFIDPYRSLSVPNKPNRRIASYAGYVQEPLSFSNGRRDRGQSLENLAQHRETVVDQLGTAYAADCENNLVMRWSKGAAQGIIIAGGNGDGAKPNQLRCPRGLSFDRHGNLYVADAGNHRVQRFNIIRGS